VSRSEDNGTKNKGEERKRKDMDQIEWEVRVYDGRRYRNTD
jgi:hypothetical protein